MIGPKDSIDKLSKNLQKVEALPMKLFDDEDELESFAENARKRHSTSSSTSTFSRKNPKTKAKSGQPEEENPPEAGPQTPQKKGPQTPQQARKDKWLEDRKKQFGMKNN